MVVGCANDGTLVVVGCANDGTLVVVGCANAYTTLDIGCYRLVQLDVGWLMMVRQWM